jgi:hypothetical protein
MAANDHYDSLSLENLLFVIIRRSYKYILGQWKSEILNLTISIRFFADRVDHNFLIADGESFETFGADRRFIQRAIESLGD